MRQDINNNKYLQVLLNFPRYIFYVQQWLQQDINNNKYLQVLLNFPRYAFYLQQRLQRDIIIIHICKYYWAFMIYFYFTTMVADKILIIINICKYCWAFMIYVLFLQQWLQQDINNNKYLQPLLNLPRYVFILQQCCNKISIIINICKYWTYQDIFLFYNNGCKQDINNNKYLQVLLNFPRYIFYLQKWLQRDININKCLQVLLSFHDICFILQQWLQQDINNNKYLQVFLNFHDICLFYNSGCNKILIIINICNYCWTFMKSINR